jgi:hypothetical protein
MAPAAAAIARAAAVSAPVGRSGAKAGLWLVDQPYSASMLTP